MLALTPLGLGEILELCGIDAALLSGQLARRAEEAVLSRTPCILKSARNMHTVAHLIHELEFSCSHLGLVQVPAHVSDFFELLQVRSSVWSGWMGLPGPVRERWQSSGLASSNHVLGPSIW